jgi:DNA-directed RNA polymerase specialized sigma24 family protein
MAKAKGWPGPLAWDDDTIDDPAARPHIGAAWSDAFDEVAVLRAMYGDPVRLRPSERAEATRRLTAAGLSAAQIAERLGCTKRSVVRQRNARKRWRDGRNRPNGCAIEGRFWLVGAV